MAKSFPGFGARKWLGTISAQRATGKWEVRWDDDPGYRQAYAETTMRKCLIHGAAAGDARDAIHGKPRVPHVRRIHQIAGRVLGRGRLRALRRVRRRDVPRLLGAAAEAADVALRHLY